MTATKLHLPFLDGLRGIAILIVFLYHALGTTFGRDQLGWNGWFRDFSTGRSFLVLSPLTYGWCGVPIFFVISGFCIHLSHQKDPHAGWTDFWSRRFFRIYPPYLLAVAVFFFLWPWGSFKGLGALSGQMQLVSHLLLAQNFDSRTLFGINPSFWSIAVEVQLYLIYPLFIILVSRMGWRNALLIACALEICGNYCDPLGAKFFGIRPPYFISYWPFTFWASWSIGAYLAQCFMDKRPSYLARVRFDVVALIAFAVPLFKPTVPLRFTAFALAAAVVIDRLISGAWKLPESRAFQAGWRHLSRLGVVSYSFYLFHQPIIRLTDHVLARALPGYTLPPLVKFGAVIAWYPFLLILSYILFVSIEMPAAKLGKGLQRNKRNTALSPK